jgi:PKD repeat protein
MRRGFRIAFIGILVAAASACAASAPWVADFTPSSWNPAAGDVVNFAVCDTCLGSGSYTYRWDYNSDGVVDAETSSTLAACTFSADGFYAVKLTERDAGGREQTRSKGILVGAMPAYGVRQVIAQDDGAMFVTITILVTSSVAAPGLIESIPSGWQIEVVDAGGATTRVNSETRELEVSWMTQPVPGDEIVFTYRLYSNYASQVKQLSGQLIGFVRGVLFSSPVCGELAIP